MTKLPAKLAAAVAMVAVIAGCSSGEPSDVKKDKLDPESLKAMQNPPPGVPGVAAPAAGAPAPGKPSEGASPLGTEPPGSEAGPAGTLVPPGTGG